MISYLTTSIFDSEAQTLVNPVNTEGVMGAGLAKEFKWRWPEMFEDYREMCLNGWLEPGRLHLWPPPWGGNPRADPPLGDHWVLCLPTKTLWRLPSSLTLIQAGLESFQASYEALGITSAAFPALGCGLGGLKWEEQARPLMERYLSELAIPVDIHLPREAKL